jgi:hypothetical protein
VTALARFKFLFAWMIAILGAAAWSGCDLTGQYETQFQAALEKSARQAVFDLNLHQDSSELTDAARKPMGIRLRLPRFFDNNSKQITADDPRLKMMGGAVSGVQYALERQLDDASGQFLPVYLIVASVPKTEQKADALQAALGQVAAATGPGASFADVSLDTPQGSTLSMKRLRMEPKLPNLNPKKKSGPVETKIDMYLADAGPRSVIFTWMAPKGQAEKYSFEAASQASMGTVEFEQVGDDGDDDAPPGKKKKKKKSDEDE